MVLACSKLTPGGTRLSRPSSTRTETRPCSASSRAVQSHDEHAHGSVAVATAVAVPAPAAPAPTPGRWGVWVMGLVGGLEAAALEPGGAEEIASSGQPSPDDRPLDRAAMESGTD